MNKKYIFSIVGGDKRQMIVARKLIDSGHEVRIYGLGEASFGISGAEICGRLDASLRSADVILLPLPATRDGVNINMVSGDAVKLTDVVEYAAKNGASTILGGMIPKELYSFCKCKGIEVIDYYKSEELQLKNALPSAEGSLMIAMEHTDVTVSDMKAMVCGYGRIGKILCSLLSKLGAEVTVAARRDEVLCEAAVCGYKTARLNEADELCCAANNASVIFNTVPHVIFHQSIIERIKHDPLYIEIASNPGGIDVSAARRAGMQVIFAPSLPGKYAPVSAGRYIFETVIDILNELELSMRGEDK